MEKNFEMPTINVVVFENEDVITTSGLNFAIGDFAFPTYNPFRE